MDYRAYNLVAELQEYDQRVYNATVRSPQPFQVTHEFLRERNLPQVPFFCATNGWNHVSTTPDDLTQPTSSLPFARGCGNLFSLLTTTLYIVRLFRPC